MCQVDDSQKNSYFINEPLLAISIVAIASEGFVAESDGILSDSYDFSFSITTKLFCWIADAIILDLIKSSFLSR
jgi:hypothetical protein